MLDSHSMHQAEGVAALVWSKKRLCPLLTRVVRRCPWAVLCSMESHTTNLEETREDI